MPYFMTEDNCKIFYEDKGQGDPIVLVHGWGCNRHYFKYQVEALKSSYRVITFDLRGHGDSERSDKTEYHLCLPQLGQDLFDLIEFLELKDVTIAGWSMGAQVVYDYVRNHGCENVKKLCFIDMTPKILVDDEWELGQMYSLDAKSSMEFASLAASDWNAAADSFIPLMFDNGDCKNPALLEWALQTARRNTPHCMVDLILSMSAQDYRDVLPMLQVPTLFIHGEHSILFGTRIGEYLHSVVPNSSFKVIPESGHALFIEQPELFNKALLEFLA
jgi:pimeloyl-ACP methyl ester carboxylesterase